MKSYIITIFILLSQIAFLFSQEKQSVGNQQFSLQEAIDFALKNSAETKNANIDIDIAKKKIWETTSIGLPQITGKIAYQNMFKVPEMSLGKFLDPRALPFVNEQNPTLPRYLTAMDIANAYKDAPSMKLGVVDNTTFDLNVTQIVFSGEYLVGLQASKVYKMISEQGLKKTEAEIKEAVTNTYQLVLITQENRKLLDSLQLSISGIISDMDALNKKGFIEDTDVDQLRLTETNLKNAISTIERQTYVAKNLLKMQVGLPVETEITLTDNLDKFISTITTDNLTSQKFDATGNISYQMLETQEKLVKLNMKRYQASCLPTVVAFYRHQEMAKTPEFNFNPKDIVGLSIDIPIFASGMRHSRIQQNKLELQKIQNLKEKAGSGLTVEYNQALSAFNNATEKYNREKENVVLAKKIYDKNIAKKKAGMGSSLELSQTQSQYLQAQTQVYMSLFEVFSAKNKLDRIISSSGGK